MPFSFIGPAIGAATAIAGAATAGSGSSGGFSGGSAQPQTYIPAGQQHADILLQSMQNELRPYAAAVPGQVIPGAIGAANRQASNPYGPQLQAGANTAGAYQTGTLAPMLQRGAASLTGLGQSATPYGQQILQTGFDPQKALYDRTLQQTTDQSNAINAMYGLGSSPAGAGLTQKAVSDFNINWQNEQLKRQAEAAQGYGNIVSGSGRALAGGADLGTGAASALQSGSALPYQTYQGAQGDILNALNTIPGSVSGAFGPDTNLANMLNSYLGLGQSATTIAQQGAKTNFAQNQALGQGFGSSLTGLGNSLKGLFGPPSGNTGNSGMNIYGPGGSNPYGASGALGTNPYGTNYGF